MCLVCNEGQFPSLLFIREAFSKSFAPKRSVILSLTSGKLDQGSGGLFSELESQPTARYWTKAIPRFLAYLE